MPSSEDASATETGIDPPATNPAAPESIHVSVMPDEIVQWIGEINPRVIVDGTYGGGGHSRLLLDVLPDQGNKSSGDASNPDFSDGAIVGMDRDPAVSERVETESNDPRIQVFLGSYEKAPVALDHLGLASADGFVLDLGLSSDQLQDRQRGFSFNTDGELDLRFDPDNGQAAWEWLARNKEVDIANAIYQYGEERKSRWIANAIVAAARRREPVKTVQHMVDICRRCVPRSKNHDIHPATRTFQALRIVVNEELDILQRTLNSAPEWIAPGGRIAVISFHSLEDRIVKNAFRDDDRWNILTKKPLRPTDSEVQANPRSRSAKLRVAERA